MEKLFQGSKIAGMKFLRPQKSVHNGSVAVQKELLKNPHQQTEGSL